MSFFKSCYQDNEEVPGQTGYREAASWPKDGAPTEEVRSSEFSVSTVDGVAGGISGTVNVMLSPGPRDKRFN